MMAWVPQQSVLLGYRSVRDQRRVPINRISSPSCRHRCHARLSRLETGR